MSIFTLLTLRLDMWDQRTDCSLHCTVCLHSSQNRHKICEEVRNLLKIKDLLSTFVIVIYWFMSEFEDL